MKKTIAALGLLALIAGCAKPLYMVDQGGKLASVTYIREDVNHYISEDSGNIISKNKKDQFPGTLFSTQEGRSLPTTIYVYKSRECSGSPAIMGHLKPYQGASATLPVKAGVPLVNVYRTKYQTCKRECYKHFYTSSVFVPKENMHYEVVVEPINGVSVYTIEQGKRVKQDVDSNLPASCQY